ncbi:MAG: FAD-binding oxidoreductase [Acidobacteria bacterium]|nr:FAD-binding oxidoreductase [Acidobacteriota bacterium]
MNSASVVIVGGGVLGASVAYHLARRGWKDLLVLDRVSAPGGGSTSRSTGGFRAQYSTDINVRLSLLSRGKLRDFHHEIGADPGYQPVGYLWLADKWEEMEFLRNALRVQQAAGLEEAREVRAEGIPEINPHVSTDGLLGGAFCPTDGFIRPMQILQGYLDGAQRLGVSVEWGEEIRELEIGPGGRICRVITGRKEVACQAVVNAAGAWAAPLAAMAGVDLPVTPLKRQVAVTHPFGGLPADMPMTLFLGDGFHLRVRDGRVLLLRPDLPQSEDPYDTSVEPVWVESVVRTARARVPTLRETWMDLPSCWAGLYEMSPDRHALLGAAPECENLYLINGSSGHGVMHAPALGQLLSEIISDGRATTLDVAPLRPSRFAEGDANPLPALL